MRNVYRLGRDQPHMTIDSRPGVPARIGGLAVIHADRYHVGLLAENQVRRQIVFEGGVAVGTVAQMPAVDPDVAVAVYAIEIDKDLAAAFRNGELKCLPVPTDPARQIARAAGIGRGVRAFNRPIVRQVHLPPVPIVEFRPFRAGGIGFVELPAGVEVHTFADAFRGPDRQGPCQYRRTNEFFAKHVRRARALPLYQIV